MIARGLLHHDRAANRYDLHPIVRRYAYDRLTAPDRAAAHAHLRDYFAAVPNQDKVQSLDDLTPVIELYHHTVRAGQYDEACALFRARLHNALYYQFGAYQLMIELMRSLFPDGEDKPPRLKKDSDQAWTLAALANSYSLSGQPRRAVLLIEQHNAIYEKLGNKENLAIGLGGLAYHQMPIGALRAAEANLRRYISLSQEIKAELDVAVGHQELGRLLAYRSVWAESEQELATALAMSEKQRHTQMQSNIVAYSALRELLLLRWAAFTDDRQSAIRNQKAAITFARRALELADETANDSGFVYSVRDYIRAHWLLGAAHCASDDPSASSGQALDEADRHLSEALTRCRNNNTVEAEADILLDLARLRAAQGNRDEALRLAQEALVITERSEYVLQGADVHLFLAQMALDAGDRRAALGHAKQARRLAACDGPPDYTYKVAYEEARALLAKLE